MPRTRAPKGAGRRLAWLVAVVAVVVVLVGTVVAVGRGGGERDLHGRSAAGAAVRGDRFVPVDRTRVFTGVVGMRPVVVPVAGHGRVPSDAEAVVADVQVVRPSADGWVRVTPAGTDPGVVTADVVRGVTTTGLATVALAGGGVQVRTSAGSARVSVIVAGYYRPGATGSAYTPTSTRRVLDERIGRSPTRVTVPGLPADATAVVAEVSVAAPTATGGVRVGPDGGPVRAPVQEFRRAASVANTVAVGVRHGAVSVALTAGSARVRLDLLGYYAPGAGSLFTPMTSARIHTGSVSADPLQLQLAGDTGIPGDATAVVVTASLDARAGTEHRSGPRTFRVAPYGSSARDGLALASRGGVGVAGLVPVALRRASVRLTSTTTGARTFHLDVAGYFRDGSAPSGLGNDISWPQCRSVFPAGQAHAVVGVNDGGPTTTNPCLADELAWARGSAGGTPQPRAALYVNTGNPGPQAPLGLWPSSDIDPTGTIVVSGPGSCTGRSSGVACSYMYGWDTAVRDVLDRGVTDPTAYRWWLDVETGGRWRDPATDLAVLDGMADAFAHHGVRVGVYSTGYQWAVITGDRLPSARTLQDAPSWIAVGQASLGDAMRVCAGAALLGGQVAMVQYVVGGVATGTDFDWACR